MTGAGAASPRARDLVVAIAAAAALVLGAPFIGGLRGAIRERFPASFMLIVGSATMAAIAVAVIVAVARIRDRRLLRYGAIAAALATGVIYAAATSSGSAEQDAVERFHFIEYGLLTFLFYRAWRPAGDASALVLPVLAGLLVGTLEEWFQWFVPVRVGEVRDVFLNLAAVACGLLFSVSLAPPPAFRFALKPGSGTAIGLMGAAAVLAFAGFFHSLHLGHDIHDGDIGTFDSRYPESRLRELSADRAARWRAQPPTTWRRLSREDQYMTEGLAHVQRRNQLWGSGDVAGAWAENRILEKYYEPVLDAPSYVSMSGHRWPAGQRADADRRSAAARTLDYVSDAYPYELYKWPRLYYWLVMGTLAAACLVPALGALAPGRRARGAKEEPRGSWRRSSLPPR